MAKIYIAVVGEYDHTDGEMYNSIITGFSKDEVTEGLRNFFRQEEREGHAVPECEDITYAEANGLNTIDRYNDREYRVSTIAVDIPSSEQN